MAVFFHARDFSLNTFTLQDHAKITHVNTIAERLKQAREKSGLTQPELARRSGVSQGTIGNIESGLRKQPRDLLSIAGALNVSPQWLATGAGPMRPSGAVPAVAQPPTLGEALEVVAAKLNELSPLVADAGRDALVRLARAEASPQTTAAVLEALSKATGQLPASLPATAETPVKVGKHET